MTRFVLILLGLISPIAQGSNAPPNVILIISDDQAWSDFGFMGHPHIQTPTLDRLAREGRVYTQGRVPSSLCCPSLATIITGRYPFEHGITGNEPPRPAGIGRNDERYQADLNAMIDQIDSSPTLPRLLAAKGYRSFQSGKWWLGGYERGGFTHGMTNGDSARGGRHGDAGLAIGRQGLKPILDFISAPDDRPFFVWYAPMMPHTPHDPPANLFERYRHKTSSPHIARYWAMCEWFDSTCAELLAHLDESGHADHTVIVFVVDNGWIQKPDSRGYAPRSKRSPHDAGIRTPVIIHWPKEVEPEIVSAPISSIDIAPTILSVCGIVPPPEMTGADLLNDARDPRRAVFGDVHRHNAIDIHNPSANLRYRWCVKNEWKLILPAESAAAEPQVELYNIHDDPHETTNLAQLHYEIVEELTALTNRWWSPSD